jgi:nicotinate phosphoribosyltransferase
VIEFGLRRAQGIDGGVSASRAAYVGGCAATSNLLAGRLYDIPVRGTHAHSWVMCFEDEPAAFQAYAEAMPNNCVFLVDTYDTLEGVRHAAKVGCWLRDRGHKMLGIRLDSGDLAYLSIEARKILDAAGLTDAAILASNDLDEHIITSLKQQGATISAWGVGTRLATSCDTPALGNVYKLSAIRKPGGEWEDRIKISEQMGKASIPGILQVRRYRDAEFFAGDAIYDERHPLAGGCTIVDPRDPTRRKIVFAGTESEDLLVPIFRNGKRVYQPPTLEETRRRVRDQLSRLHEGIRRFVHPHAYPAGLEAGLHQRRMAQILELRKASGRE